MELGEYDISGPNEYMSTREKKVRVPLIAYAEFNREMSMQVKRVVVHKDYKAPTFENSRV